MESNGQRRPRVLICDAIAESGVKMLREHAEVDIKTKLSPEELLDVIGGYQAVVVRSATKIRENVIEAADRLQVIGRAGAGLDNIDVVAAQERGVKVVNCPDANTRAVAEHTLALILGLARRLPRADLSMKSGRWEKSTLLGTGLSGKTLGIIGFGRIGREVAKRAQAFGMKILVNQRRPTPELNLEAKVEAVDLNDLLAQSDFVSLHVPAKPETERMISLEQLALMKPTAYLINTARGSVIDEQDLLEALDKGLIAGAALDVFAKEPAPDSDLAQHERVIATPHIAASTEDAQYLAAVTVAEQIIDVLKETRVADIEIPLSLRVVPTEKVLPHENTDPRRVERLAERLEEDGRLVNPPVVVNADDHYVVLDGATRVKALKKLNYPHLVVQVASPKEGLNLHTWHHAIRQVEPAELESLLDGLPEITMKPSDANSVLNEMIEFGGLCSLHTLERVFLVQAAPGVNHLRALNALTEAYIEAGYVTRTLNSNINQLKSEYPDVTALVIFPEYTVEQVLQIARAGRQVPAGITRFIIPGRVLRLNADLSMLKEDKSLTEKNKWLRQVMVDKLGNSQVRYYEEPVYLLDE